MSVFIIAEAGVNHNGDIQLAHQLIEVAKQAGVNAVKFQTFVPEKLVAPTTPQADYQAENIGWRQSQLEMLQKLALPLEVFVELKVHCDEVGIEFMSTPFDEESVVFLAELGMQRFKIPSGELLSTPYLRAIASLNRPTILSTGMSTLDEVRYAVETLLHAGLSPENLTLLHCTSSYPTPPEAVNLRAMETLAKTFNLPVGLSDHTEGLEAAISATALGAMVLEKHFTLDKTLPGPDHAASLTPEELSQLVQAVRTTETMLGDGIKQPTEDERKTAQVARKRIVAIRDITVGEPLTEDNITLMRAPEGWFADQWDMIMGTPAPRAFRKGEGIQW